MMLLRAFILSLCIIRCKLTLIHLLKVSTLPSGLPLICFLCNNSALCCHRNVTPPAKCSSPSGRLGSCDQNRIMATCAAVRSSMSLTLRLSRVIPDCSTCPLYRLKTRVNNVANARRRGSSDSFWTINRHLQTTTGEWCGLLTPLALIRSYVYGLFHEGLNELYKNRVTRV